MVSIVTNFLSFVILCVFLYGRSLRKTNLPLHIKLMSTAIAADVLLVAFLVVARSALSKVHSGMPIQLIIHIFFALSTVILYAFAVYVGLKLKNGQRQYLSKMRLIDKFVTPMRILTWITSTALMFF